MANLTTPALMQRIPRTKIHSRKLTYHLKIDDWRIDDFPFKTLQYLTKAWAFTVTFSKKYHPVTLVWYSLEQFTLHLRVAGVLSETLPCFSTRSVERGWEKKGFPNWRRYEHHIRWQLNHPRLMTKARTKKLNQKRKHENSPWIPDPCQTLRVKINMEKHTLSIYFR